jgi:hypothetical protein
LDNAYGVAYGHGRFVSVGWEGAILTSTDGVNWLRISGSGATLYKIAYGNGRFVTLGSDWNGAWVIMTSPDGAAWSRQVTATNIFSDAFGGTTVELAYGNGQFVALGAAGAILTSTDGVDWAWFRQPLPCCFTLYGAAYGNGRFVKVTDPGTVAVSADGVGWDWQQLPVDSYEANNIAFGNG